MPLSSYLQKAEVRRLSPFFAPTPFFQLVKRPRTCGLHTRTRLPVYFRRSARAPAEQHPATLSFNAGTARRCWNLNAPLKLQAAFIEAIPLASSLNEATSESLRNLVWLDFDFAVPLFVIAPLGLFFGSFTGGSTHDALRRVMIGYWQASSMLMLTVFLNIAEQPIGFLSALFVQIMIPLSLFWWKDLNAEIQEAATQGRLLERLFLFWRPLATVLAGFGAFVQLSTLRCVGLTSEELLSDPQCAAWLEPPFEFYDLHVGVLLKGLVPREAFGIFAYSGLFLYLGYLVYMVAEVLPRVGRMGRVSRKGLFTSVRLLSAWGWIQDNDNET